MIVETFYIDATNTDILVAPSRLAAIPYSGTMIVEMQSNTWGASSKMDVTVQLPNGDVPLQDVSIPCGASQGAINDDDKYTLQFPVAQGGHVLISATETGTAILFVRVTLMP